MSSSPSIVDRSPFPKTRYDLCTGHYQCRQIDGLYSIEESNVSFAVLPACLAQLGWTIFLKSFGTLAHDAMPQWYSLHSPKCIWGSSDLNCEVFARASVRCWRYRNLKLIISWKYTKRSLFSVSFFPMHFWNCSKTTQNWTISALITRVMGKISEKKLLFQAPSYHYFTDS